MKKLFVAIAMVLLMAFSSNAIAGQNAQSIQFLLSQVRTSATSLVGGQVYFYSAGTTTPQTVWLDRAKTTPAANPYTLDANGTAQLYGDGLYRAVIKDSAGVTRYDRDNLSFRDASGLAYNAADYASLAVAVAAIGSNTATLQYGNAQTVSANLSVPANIELMPLNGAIITVNSGQTLTYAGSTARWPAAQMFSGTGAVILSGSARVADVLWFGAVDVSAGGSTDSTAAFNAAINSLGSSSKIGTVHYKGTYLCSAVTGYFNLPGDTSETQYTLPYSIALRSNVRLKGDRINNSIIKGGWTFGTSPVNTSQPILIYIADDAANEVQIEDTAIANAFIGILHGSATGILATGRFSEIAFSNCGFCAITNQQERTEYHNISISASGAGLISGGWRYVIANGTDAPYVSGGWQDKSIYDRIDYNGGNTHTAFDDSLDAFFLTYFWHTANPTGTYHFDAYRGVSKVSVGLFSRYSRGSFSVSLSNFFHYGASRYAIMGNSVTASNIKNINVEKCGYSSAGVIFGTGYTNPYLAGKIEGFVNLPNGSKNVVENVYVITSAAAAAVAPAPTSIDKNIWAGIYGTANGTDMPASSAAYMSMGGPVSVIGTGGANLLQMSSDTSPSINQWAFSLRDIAEGDFALRDLTSNATRVRWTSAGATLLQGSLGVYGAVSGDVTGTSKAYKLPIYGPTGLNLGYLQIYAGP